MCVTICGRFCPDEGVVAGYDNRIRVKYTAKWGVQIAGMIFQTGSRATYCAYQRNIKTYGQPAFDTHWKYKTNPLTACLDYM